MARCPRAGPGAAVPREELGSPPAASAVRPARMAPSPQRRGAHPRPALKVALPPAAQRVSAGPGPGEERGDFRGRVPAGKRWAAHGALQVLGGDPVIGTLPNQSSSLCAAQIASRTDTPPAKRACLKSLQSVFWACFQV